MSKKTCNSCKKERPLYDFYKSESIMFSDGYVPLCKKCLKEMIDENDIESVKSTLQKIDKPFVAKIWLSAEKNEQETVGTYLRMMNSLSQYKGWGWNDSVFDGEKDTEMYKHKFENISELDELADEEGNAIRLTKEIAMKFGSGFTNLEYLSMEKFYSDMRIAHSIDTPQLKKQIITMCKLQVHRDRALEQGDSTAFKKYNDSYEAILKSSALAPRDRKSSDETVGIRNFSTVFEEVEKNGFVEPKKIEERMDLVDLNILVHLNYTRTLHGMDKLSKVPDEIREEYIHEEGIIHESE